MQSAHYATLEHRLSVLDFVAAVRQKSRMESLGSRLHYAYTKCTMCYKVYNVLPYFDSHFPITSIIDTEWGYSFTSEHGVEELGL